MFLEVDVRLRLETLGFVECMARANVTYVAFAIETASPRLQKMIRKNLDLDRVQHVIGEMADRRILTRGFFMLGLPTETLEEMRATIRFAHRSRLHMALFFSVNSTRSPSRTRMKLPGTLPPKVQKV